jgi:hypothetical protein
VVDELNITVGKELIANLTVFNVSNLTVKMSYVDPPTSHLGDPPLYADLDLIITTPDGQKLYSNECRQVNERVHIDHAVPGLYQIRIVCWQMFTSKTIHFAVAAVGQFSKSGFLEFSERDEMREGCSSLRTGHFCEIRVSGGIPESFASKARRFHYFSLEFPVISNQQCLALTIEAIPLRCAIVQVELSLKQFAKFGGELIRWQVLRTPKTSFTIYWDEIKELANITLLYLSIFTATDKECHFKLHSSVISNTTRNIPATTRLPENTVTETSSATTIQMYSAASTATSISVQSVMILVVVFFIAIITGFVGMKIAQMLNQSFSHEGSFSDPSTFPTVPLAARADTITREPSNVSDHHHSLINSRSHQNAVLL